MPRLARGDVNSPHDVQINHAVQQRVRRGDLCENLQARRRQRSVAGCDALTPAGEWACPTLLTASHAHSSLRFVSA